MYPGRHMSKSHPEQWTVREVAERPDRSLVTALREFATTQIADCGGPVAVVGPPLRHLAAGPQLCGPAVTVWTKPGDILYVLKAADLIAAGDVLVVDGGGRADAAVIGDIAGQVTQRRGHYRDRATAVGDLRRGELAQRGHQRPIRAFRDLVDRPLLGMGLAHLCLLGNRRSAPTAPARAGSARSGRRGPAGQRPPGAGRGTPPSY